MGHFSHSVWAKNYQFCIRIRKKWKIWIFEIHYASNILNSKVKFKNHIFQYCLILLQNWYFLAKTEWEKCPISDILDKLTKLFQIRQVWASLCDNKPYPKGAIHMIPPGLFFTDLGRLWRDFVETFRKWTLTLISKGYGVKIAKKNSRWQLGCLENSQKFQKMPKFHFWARVTKIDGEVDSYVYLKGKFFFAKIYHQGVLRGSQK